MRKERVWKREVRKEEDGWKQQPFSQASDYDYDDDDDWADKGRSWNWRNRKRRRRRRRGDEKARREYGAAYWKTRYRKKRSDHSEPGDGCAKLEAANDRLHCDRQLVKRRRRWRLRRIRTRTHDDRLDRNTALLCQSVDQHFLQYTHTQSVVVCWLYIYNVNA